MVTFPTDSCFLHGNSFHGTGGRGNKYAQMRYTLRLLRAMVYLEDEIVNTDLCERGVIHQLIGKVFHGSSLGKSRVFIILDVSYEIFSYKFILWMRLSWKFSWFLFHLVDVNQFSFYWNNIVNNPINIYFLSLETFISSIFLNLNELLLCFIFVVMRLPLLA